MLKSHLDAVEGSILAISRIPANAGHSLHKGTPREAFIREFLETHLSERAAIGTGEIIDANSKPNPPPSQQRNQYDIVIYKRDYPKLVIGGGISAFLAESVVATIEVKSVLSESEFEGSVKAARAAKTLARHISGGMFSGYHPPSILNYVVAYDGPASMRTVHGWIASVHAGLGIPMPALQQGPTRTSTASPSVDGVFILGRGFLTFGNASIGFIDDELLRQFPHYQWQFADSPTGNLLYFFLLLTQAVSGFSTATWTPEPYLSNVNVNVEYGG